MTRRRRVMMWGGLALAFLAILLVILREPSQSITLPDGSTLRLLKTGYGRTSHVYFRGSLFDQLLYRWVPESWMRAAQWRGMAAPGAAAPGKDSWRTKLAAAASRHYHSISSETNALVLWIQYTPSDATNSDCALRVWAVDDTEAAWGVMPNMAAVKKLESASLFTASLPAFPRRGDKVRLRLFALKGGYWETAGEFFVRNPCPSNTPSWPAATLPATAMVDGEEISLRHFWSGVGSGTPPREVPPIEGGDLLFEFTSGDGRLSDWSFGAPTLTDVTGNAWRGQTCNKTAERHGFTLRFGGRVPANETLRIEATLLRQRNFKPDQLWKVRDVPLPRPGQYTTATNATMTREGVAITFLGVAAPDVEFPGSAVRSTEPTVHLVSPGALTNPAVRELRLSVVEILDEHGSIVGKSQFPFSVSPPAHTWVTYPTNLTRATFVFALHRPTNVIFHARAESAGR